jgi:RNA polymerase sigma-70 factor (ECF subfamily)
MIQRDRRTSEDHPTPPDIDLVRSAQAGSLEAFTALYRRYLPLVYNRVRYRVPAMHAEDVTQEVFMAVVKSLKTYKGRAAFSTWLRTLTDRCIAQYYRRRKNVGVMVDIDQAETNPEMGAGLRVETDVDALHDRIMLQKALRVLPAHYREIILLRFAEGLPFDEIAQLRGQSLEATKSLYRRAIAALRKQLEKQSNA